MLPEPTVERLSRYRRILQGLQDAGRSYLFSHELAELAHSTPAQVRRDVMLIGHSGSPAKGYDVAELLRAVGKELDHSSTRRAALVGLGNLGRALVDYFSQDHPRLQVVAAFDVAPDVLAVGEYGGCPVHAMTELERVIRSEDLRVAILAVPAPVAQEVADRLITAGITGLVSFAPTPLRPDRSAFVENVDIAAAWEKVAYFARRTRRKRRRNPEA